MIAALLMLATPTAAQQADIRKYFDSRLIDGPSARWKWPPRSDNKALYCGWVNSKNKFGGYTGWTPYFVIFDGQKVSSGGVMDDNRVISQIFGEKCQKEGYNVTSPPD